MIIEHETYDTRRANLLRLIRTGKTSVADINSALGRARTNRYLYAILNGVRDSATGRTRQLGAKMARSIEQALKLPDGYLDQQHDSPAPASAVAAGATASMARSSSSSSSSSTALVALPVAAESSTAHDDSRALSLSRDCVEQLTGTRAIDNLRIYRAATDDLKPVIQKNDLVLYDPQDHFPRAGVFLMRVQAGNLLLRRLQADLVGTLMISADALPGAAQFDDSKIEIVGRAVFALRGIHL